MKFEKVSEIQKLFFEAVFDLEKTANFIPHIVEKQSIKAENRLQIYQEAYRERLINSLREDFNRVQSSLTEDLFEELINKFIHQIPSKYTNLAEFSESFTDFIKAYHPDLLKAALMDWTEIKSENALEPEDAFSGNNFKESDTFQILLHPASLLITVEETTFLAYRTNLEILFIELSSLEIELYSLFSTEKSQSQILKFIEENQFDPPLVTTVISEWVAKRIVYCKLK